MQGRVVKEIIKNGDKGISVRVSMVKTRLKAHVHHADHDERVHARGPVHQALKPGNEKGFPNKHVDDG